MSHPHRKTARNNAIYSAYMDEGRTMNSLADEYGLSQPRISAIIQAVHQERIRSGGFMGNVKQWRILEQFNKEKRSIYTKEEVREWLQKLLLA